jgi:putative SOS response-associated peptidase YedK
MCGRIIQASTPFRLAIVDGLDVVDSRFGNIRPRYNGAPSQEILVIRQNQRSGERSLDPLAWGLIPYGCTDPKGGRKPINARAETVATLGLFRDAYRKRRCIIPVDGYFEWRSLNGLKQPYAIGMRDAAPFAIAGVWENWKRPGTDEWVRTFAIITVPANALMGQIHDRMPAILAPESFDRWLGAEPDPRDLLISFPADAMTMWPISMRVNSARNDDADLLARVALA